MTQKPYGTVLLKAATILDYLAEAPNKPLQEIAEATKLTPSTALKILETLQMIGYVKRDKEKNYRLGSKLIKYANQNIQELDLVEISLPYLEALQKTADETIHLGVLTANEILYVNKLEPQNQTIRMSSKVGITRPLYSSAMGKAVLAEFETTQVDEYLAATPLTAYTENTITNQLKLKKELEQVKASHVAFDDEEMEQEIYCIGASLVKDHEIIGAFSISLPKYRLTPDYQRLLIDAIIATKQQIEQAL
ncbi:IclR family transcriptional regulator [Enterococcus sp.]|jgi:IclR family KDG regulon transcriptional repressor|uniref:IclR family transcriptional regulator n=1 Tax=Enterococcus sp. TaxID=35783 RepID=UPI0025C6C8B6|nr:IclR family transcriptional regulator [Enterococcus sp.]